MTADDAGQFGDVVKKHFGPDSRLAIRGSAVTGLKFNGETQTYGLPEKDRSGNPIGRMRQFGKNSDFDFAIVDEKLLDDIKGHPELGQVAGNRPGRSLGIGLNKLDETELAEHSPLWNLREILKDFQDITGRRHSIMIYRSDRDIEDRGPYMWLGQ
ncbi:hypothetical protein GH722_01135 [Alphaproteobacteria bacterium HT1-32]|nr:hypothetical protein [Alphaproteobacteria bacterium HT1-32]